MSCMADSDYAFSAEARALRQYIADLPDPAVYAHELPLSVVDALGRVEQGRNGPRAVNNADGAILRRYGLCDYPSKISDGRDLTNFGRAVRRELLPWLES